MKNKERTEKFHAYKKTEITTANRETVLLMLYKGTLRYLNQAIIAHEKNLIEDRNNYIARVTDIIGELRATLNHNIESDLASRLNALYLFLGQHLTEGLAQNKVANFKECLGILTTLNDGWEKAIQSLKKSSLVAD